MIKASSFVGLAALIALLSGCSASSGGTSGGDSCSSDDECTSGRCVDGTCSAPSEDGGADSMMEDGAIDSMVPPPMDSGMLPDSSTPPDATPDSMVMMDTGVPPGPGDDADGDGISDFQEGRSAMGGPPDTDADGVPDYLDTDSDGDTIPDSIEAGDSMVSTPPVDSDFDGTPDFRDLDSDDNGIPDLTEGIGDVDGDMRFAYRDFDNDGDGLSDVMEIGADARAPIDADTDGTPDYEEIDSDGDTIADAFEGHIDTDGDGSFDARDTDTDGDGFSDAVEAGDADLATDPIDTDGDLIPDFRDPDSDGDGLSDVAEAAAGTDRVLADSDSDGVDDLIEVGAGTDPLDASDSPRTRGDFVFLVPYMAPPSPTRDTLQFSTVLQKADVYFLVDTTGSMGGEIANLRSALSTTIIPMVRGRIPDAWFGVGGFDDYPNGTYGSGSDRPFYLRQQMTTSTSAAQAAVNGLPLHFGNDYPESHIPALWSLASRGALWTGPAMPTCPAGYRGAACFRPDAVPVIVVITDAISHNYSGGGNYSGISPTPPTLAATMAALNAIGARVVGVNSGGTDARDMLRDFARQTGTLDAGGSPNSFVLPITSSGTGLGTAAVDAIFNAAQVPIEVSAQASDLMDAGETVDAVAAFLDHLEARGTAAGGLTCTTGLSTYDRPGIDGDGFHDTFRAVLPGTPVCFDIVPRTNNTVMPTLMPQLFRAQIDVLGDGFTPLDDRIIFFLVPPRVPDPNE